MRKSSRCLIWRYASCSRRRKSFCVNHIAGFIRRRKLRGIRSKNTARSLPTLGMKAEHWLIARKVWMWVFPSMPYVEDYERENILLGADSAFYRFYTLHILKPMVVAHERWEDALPPAALEEIRDSWRHISERKREMGIEFYHMLFRMHPEIIPYFGRSDMDHLAVHLFQSLDFMVHCLNDWDAFLPELRELSRSHSRYGVPREAYPKIARPIFAVFEKHIPGFNKDLPLQMDEVAPAGDQRDGPAQGKRGANARRRARISGFDQSRIWPGIRRWRAGVPTRSVVRSSRPVPT